MPLLLQTSGIPNLVFKLGHCVEVLGYLNSQWAKTKAGQNNIRAMSADLHKDSCGLGPRNCQFENRVSQILAKAKECVMDYNSWVRMIARNHLKESSKIWLQFKNVEYVVGKMGCFYVLVCILCYGTYVFNCYTTCLHTLHFSVISKLNKGYSANADLFYLNYQTQSALRNTLMLLSKVFFMKTTNCGSMHCSQ